MERKKYVVLDLHKRQVERVEMVGRVSALYDYRYAAVAILAAARPRKFWCGEHGRWLPLKAAGEMEQFISAVWRQQFCS